MPRSEAEENLAERIAYADDHLLLPIRNTDDLNNQRTQYGKWDKFNQLLLQKMFSDDSCANEYKNSILMALVGGVRQRSLAEKEQEFLDQVKRKRDCLESLKDRLSLFNEVVTITNQPPADLAQPPGSDVFLVHGHVNGEKEMVARFFEKLHLEVVILHEQPNQGKTIIEKLETHSERCGFAVVLLTPDDFGRLSTETEKDGHPRARQNVILELGFFMGKLGRSRVAAIYREGVELPSDFNGVVYTPLDDGGAWKITLTKELQAAGFSVDLNDAV